MNWKYAVSFGIEKKRADIVIFDKDNKRAPYILIELKKPKLKEHLLETAKRAVEIAVEQDEEEAIRFIEKRETTD